MTSRLERAIAAKVKFSSGWANAAAEAAVLDLLDSDGCWRAIAEALDPLWDEDRTEADTNRVQAAIKGWLTEEAE